MRLDNNVNNNVSNSDISGLWIIFVVSVLIVVAITLVGKKIKKTHVEGEANNKNNSSKKFNFSVTSNDSNQGNNISVTLEEYFCSLQESYFKDYLLSKYVDRFDLEDKDEEYYSNEVLYKSLLDLNIISQSDLEIAKESIINLFNKIASTEKDIYRNVNVSTLFDRYTRLCKELGNEKALQEVQNQIGESNQLKDLIEKNKGKINIIINEFSDDKPYDLEDFDQRN